MKVLITKTWYTEELVEAPDNLSNEELKDWIANNAEKHANIGPHWDGTTATDPATDEEIACW